MHRLFGCLGAMLVAATAPAMTAFPDRRGCAE